MSDCMGVGKIQLETNECARCRRGRCARSRKKRLLFCDRVIFRRKREPCGTVSIDVYHLRLLHGSAYTQNNEVDEKKAVS